MKKKNCFSLPQILKKIFLVAPKHKPEASEQDKREMISMAPPQTLPYMGKEELAEWPVLWAPDN